MTQKHYTIGKVSALTGLTVRALHHYDAIGLVSPSQRSGGGYRLYTDEDLQRLQQVLLFRELGFSLDAVRDLVDANTQTRLGALLRQRGVLEGERIRADTVLRAIDTTLESLKTGILMNTEKLFEGYSQFSNGEYAAEAEQRWGNTSAWKESRRRTDRYAKDDWKLIEQEAQQIVDDFLLARRNGANAVSETAMAIAERHRLHIDRWFYPCSHAMHVGVAALYTADPRFQAYYDKHEAGLAEYIEAAIRANAEGNR